MKRRYALLIAAVALAAVTVSVLARLPRAVAPRAHEQAAVLRADLALTLDDGRIAPESSAVPKGHLVRLRLTNHGAAAASVRLAGYEDRVTITGLAPGATWTGEFIADRPGMISRG